MFLAGIGNCYEMTMEMPFKPWQVEKLRLSAFQFNASETGDTPWWTDLVGVQPESSLLNKRDKTLQE